MKKIISFILVYLLIYSSIFNNAYSLGQSTYYTSVASTVYDRSNGQVTRSYNINTSLSSLQNGPDNRVVTRTTQARNLANRLRNAATRSNLLGLAVTAAVAAVGWGITEIKKDLYGNDIQQYGRSTTGTEYKISNVFYDTGWRPSINDAVSNYLENAHGTTVQKQFIELFNNDKNLKYKTINGSSETILNASITSRTDTITEELQDSELTSLVQEQFTPEQYNEIYAIPDYVPNTIQEVKALQLDVIKDAYPEQVPFATISNDVSSVTVIPGSAPEIKEVTINETNTDTTPEEVAETYGNPWEELLPNGQTNPNYDPRTDLNSDFYDPTKDPRIIDSTNIKDAELLKQQTEFLKQLKTLQEQQVQQQLETKAQVKNNNKESTQQQVKNALQSIDQTLKETKTQTEQLPELKCGGDSGISCEATQSEILTEIKKITSPETEENPDVKTAQDNFTDLWAKYEAIPIVVAANSLNFGFSGQSCETPSINFDILGQSVNGDLSMVCTVINDIQTEIGHIMLFLFGILSLFLLLRA